MATFDEADGAPELVASFVRLPAPQWAQDIGTRHRTSRRIDAPLKVEVMAQAADLLSTFDIANREDLLAQAENRELRRAWTSLPGQSTGSTWRHPLLTAGHTQPLVCPLTRAFMRRTVGHPVADDQALTVLREMAQHLDAPVLDADHQVWRAGHGASLPPR